MFTNRRMGGIKMKRAVFGIVLTALVLSLSACFPEPPVGMPKANVIGYEGNHAIAPDCNALTQESTVIDSGFRRPSMQWGCATYTNMAAQIANPQDLVAPKPLGPADAAVAAGAVRRYETGQVMKLDAGTTRDAK